MYHSFFWVEGEKNKRRERKHRNYSEIMIQRKTENEEMMQSLSTAKQRFLTKAATKNIFEKSRLRK